MPKLANGDTKTLTPLDKGKILYLHSIGQTKKQIAGTVNRSMGWVEDLISALEGTQAKEDLIAEYQKELKKNDKN